VPDLTAPGQRCSPSAQHAVRQAKVLADNIIRTCRQRRLHVYRHRHVGSVASLGLHRGVAEIYGVRLRGLPAWLVHRTYHAAKMPTIDRKVRIILDWTLALCLRREVVSLGILQRPREGFEQASRAGRSRPAGRAARLEAAGDDPSDRHVGRREPVHP
jgi:NADH dehydrogenase